MTPRGTRDLTRRRRPPAPPGPPKKKRRRLTPQQQGGLRRLASHRGQLAAFPKDVLTVVNHAPHPDVPPLGRLSRQAYVHQLAQEHRRALLLVLRDYSFSGNDPPDPAAPPATLVPFLLAGPHLARVLAILQAPPHRMPAAARRRWDTRIAQLTRYWSHPATTRRMFARAVDRRAWYGNWAWVLIDFLALYRVPAHAWALLRRCQTPQCPKWFLNHSFRTRKFCTDCRQGINRGRARRRSVTE